MYIYIYLVVEKRNGGGFTGSRLKHIIHSKSIKISFLEFQVTLKVNLVSELLSSHPWDQVHPIMAPVPVPKKPYQIQGLEEFIVG